MTDLLELVQLGWLADQSPRAIVRRTAPAYRTGRALAVEPKVLLLDEPFGALDAKVRKELRRWLRQLHDELHISSIFVTHDQEEALELADRVVLMNRGRVEQVGTPKEVYGNPASAFVYGFLGPSTFSMAASSRARLPDPAFASSSLSGSAVDGTDMTAFARPHQISLSPEAEWRGRRFRTGRSHSGYRRGGANRADGRAG